MPNYFNGLNMQHIAYYITGHGYGHATRSICIISCLLAKGHTVSVISSIPECFFRNSNPSWSNHSVNFYQRCLDSGAVQSNPLEVDALATIESYYCDVHLKRATLVEIEINFLTESKVNLVIVDATPIVCYCGKAAGIPVLIISNFTWDVCYREMLSVISPLNVAQSLLYQEMIDECSSDYCCASLYLQLPGETPLPKGFNIEALTHGPLVARRGFRNAQDIRNELGISERTPLVLLSFGGHNSLENWTLSNSFVPGDWKCLVSGTNGWEENLAASDRFIKLDNNCYLPDYIEAADVMIGKLGYGTVSECLANETPLIYISRSNWAEEKYLADLMSDFSACVNMPVIDFFSGRWEPYLTQALDLRNAWNTGTLPESVNLACDIVYQSVSRLLDAAETMSTSQDRPL